MNERMKDEKKEIESVELRPFGMEWGINVVVKAGVYGHHKVGFNFEIRTGTLKTTLTANQLNEVIGEIERQIDERGAGNVPKNWRTLLHNLKY